MSMEKLEKGMGYISKAVQYVVAYSVGAGLLLLAFCILHATAHYLESL
jgi:hypothetical protein